MSTATQAIGSAGAIRIVTSLVSQNQAGNSSTINVKAYLDSSSTSRSYNNGSISKSVYGAGSWSGSGPFDVPAGGSVLWIDINFTITHDAAGNLSTGFGVTIGATGTYTFGTGGAVTVNDTWTRIPKRPSVAGTPTFTNVLPTSVTVSWAASTDNGGSAINWYLLRRWDNAAGTDAYTDAIPPSVGQSYSVTGLTPGQSYRFVAYAHNSSADNGGYSNISAAAVVQMLAGVRIKVASIYKLAIPYVKTSGVYKMAIPYVKYLGLYKLTG